MIQMPLLRLTLFLLGAMPVLSAQVCSTGSTQLFQDDKAVSGPCNISLMVGDFVTVTETQGYNLKCATTQGNSNPGSVFFADSVALTGHGQRFCGTIISDPLFCDPTFSMTVTQATSVSDFHRFTFIENDRTPGTSKCNVTAQQQIFRQCAGQPCDGSSGGGVGGCDQFLGGGDGPAPLQTCGDTSPVIIDTEGEGFHLTSATNGVSFDIRGDGHPVQIAWTAPGSHNAFLVLDRNGDGKISSGKELFGNSTAQDRAKHKNGFLALAEFDEADQGGNGDGVIDGHDAVFAKLRLWIDENHDGIAQPNELHTLPELGVFAIALDYETSPKRDQYGNEFRYKARINPGERRNKRDEASEVGRWTYDVFLVTKQ